MPELAGITYDRRGSGTPLVLVHGVGSRWQVWLPVLDRLAAEHDVISVDVPGFGASPRPGRDTPAGVPSLSTLLETFFAELGIGTPHVAGNSMGGWIALELARRGAVASATALDPGGFATRLDNLYIFLTLSTQRLSSHLIRPVASSLFKSALGRSVGFGQMVAHPEHIDPDEAVLSLQGLSDATWFWPTFAQLVTHGFGDGADITAPVTIAWGTKDRLLFPRQAATALAKIPTASFVSLPNCGHLPMYDDPELVCEAILRTTAAGAAAHAAS
jgi:pimeloyl-ACP methyl ester carboxylesterase